MSRPQRVENNPAAFRPIQVAATAAALTVALLGCARHPGRVAATHPWPSYLASDYAQPGNPQLRDADIAKLRSVLSQVTPCQRNLLRYAIARDGRFVLFFLPTGMPFTDTYALNAGNVFYDGYNGTASGSQSAAVSEPKLLQLAIKRTGCDGLWPRYFANDYAKPGHPPLTTHEVAKIRWMLGRVEPCQKKLLSYAFNSEGALDDSVAGVDSKGFVMFFSVTSPYYRWLAERHVLGGQNILYEYESGRVSAFPNQEGTRFTIQRDIDQTDCNGNPKMSH